MSTIRVNNIQDTSGSSIFTLNSNGRAQKSTASIPAFYAYQSGPANTGGGSTLIFTTQFNSTLINTGGCYNTGNGRFTAPYAGTYFFGGKLLQRGSTRVEYTFFKNGANASPPGRGMVYANSDNHGDMYAYIFINLAAGDYVQMGPVGEGQGDAYYGDNLANFYGYLFN